MTYTRKPLRVDNGIPIFTQDDEYTDNYDAISAEHLDHLRDHGTNPWMAEAHWTALEDATREMLARHGPGEGRLLDVGVGLGRLVAGLPYDLYGVDISLGYLAHAQEQGIRVCYARAEDMPFEDGWFDAVTCTDVLEHVLDLNRCVTELLRVLRPGGTLIVRSPSRENLDQYLDYKYRFVHLRLIDGDMLVLMFDRVFGCQVVERVEVNREVIAAVVKP